jgi:hypothetical protein
VRRVLLIDLRARARTVSRPGTIWSHRVETDGFKSQTLSRCRPLSKIARCVSNASRPSIKHLVKSTSALRACGSEETRLLGRRAMASSLDQAHLTMLVHLCASEPIVVQTLPVAGRVGVHFGNLAVRLRPHGCAKSQRQNLILPFLLLGFVSGLAGSKSSSCLQTPPISHPDINCPMSVSLVVFHTLAWPPLSHNLFALCSLHYLRPFTICSPSPSILLHCLYRHFPLCVHRGVFHHDSPVTPSHLLQLPPHFCRSRLSHYQASLTSHEEVENCP